MSVKCFVIGCNFFWQFLISGPTDNPSPSPLPKLYERLILACWDFHTLLRGGPPLPKVYKSLNTSADEALYYSIYPNS